LGSRLVAVAKREATMIKQASARLKCIPLLTLTLAVVGCSSFGSPSAKVTLEAALSTPTLEPTFTPAYT
jgi:hypothetical protein